MSLIEVTRRVVDGSMQGVYSFLKFTTETGEDFGDDWLPTLDLSLKVDARGQVLWKFYEKPTASEVTVQARSAMGFLVKGQILANDLVRRLLNTSESLPQEERRLVIDDYARKLRRSGHDKKRTAEIVLAGIR